ncbi:MAG: oxygenase MpaB family protein [Acidobacteriota bacterium]
MSRRIHAERLVLLGWSRAILLQLSHPLMAAAVAAHSSFRSGPVGAAVRLRHTVGAMLALTFGDAAAQARALAGIRAIHDRVNGTLERAVGRFPKGTPYSANDPDLLLWVHVSLLESVVLAHDAFVRPLNDVERDAYCEESAPIAVRLGARLAEVPRTWRALVECVGAIEASGALCVGDDAKSVASAVLSPPMSAAIWPVRWLNRQFTISTLPDDLLRQYGFERDQNESARGQRATQFIRGVRSITPRRLAQWGASRR